MPFRFHFNGYLKGSEAVPRKITPPPDYYPHVILTVVGDQHNLKRIDSVLEKVWN